MKKVCFLLSIVLILSMFGGCSESEDSYTENFFAMDTVMSITAYGKSSESAVKSAVDEINRLDSLLSTESGSSEVALINKNGGGTLSDDTARLLQDALEVYNDTDGAFDITVYPVMKAWGFTDQNYTVPSDSELEALRPLIGSDKLSYDDYSKELDFDISGMAIDFGGIAKGYAADRAAEILKDNGIESATISLGGNVYVLGNKNGVPWKVAIQNPFDTNGDYYGIISAEDCSIITSGDYQRYFEKDGIKYHHIIDPSTLKPADSGLVSVTIVTENGAIGDGLSTALFVMGLDAACSYWRNHSSEFDFVIIDSAGNTYVSSGLENSFSSDMEFELIY